MTDRETRYEAIDDFLHGGMAEADARAFEREMESDPELRSLLNSVREQDRLLKTLGTAMLSEPIPPGLRAAKPREAAPAMPAERASQMPPPDAIVPPLQAMISRGGAMVMPIALMVALVVGGAGGWWLHALTAPRQSPVQSVLNEAAQTFAFFSDTKDYPLQFPPDLTAQFEGLLSDLFGKSIPYPQLEEDGYRFAGGSVLPGSAGSIALFMYVEDGGERLSLFAWASSSQPSSVISPADLGETISARYWQGRGLGFAVLGNAGNKTLDRASDRIFKFYQDQDFSI